MLELFELESARKRLGDWNVNICLLPAQLFLLLVAISIAKHAFGSAGEVQAVRISFLLALATLAAFIGRRRMLKRVVAELEGQPHA